MRLRPLLLLLLFACAPPASKPAPTSPKPVVTPDPPAPASLDAARPGQRIEGEPVVLPAAIAIGERATFVRFDGGRVSGELLHRYDHRPWWTDPSDEITYALFDEGRFAAWPDDRRVIFVPGSRLSHAVRLPAASPTWREALRERGVVMSRPPLDGVIWVATGHDGYHLEENGGGDFAWDLVRADVDGVTWENEGFVNEDYLVFGDPIYLPIDGVIVDAFDPLPDNPPGAPAAVSDAPPCGTNNCVGVHLGGQLYLYMLHLQEGSIPDEIVVGQPYPAGTLVGRVGNSGVSLEPHLHLSLLFYDEPGGRSWSVPMEIADLYVSDDVETPATLEALHDPATGEWISADPF